jgi:DOPA 4,5-dioxygenase
MTDNKGYHAHVYYNAETKPTAAKLRAALAGKFKLEAGGGLSDEPRGPHPVPQFNVIFETPEFDSVVPWLMLNRDGLDVLLHPLTDSSYNDHTAYAMWLGAPVPLKTEILRHVPVGDNLMPSALRQSAQKQSA